MVAGIPSSLVPFNSSEERIMARNPPVHITLRILAIVALAIPVGCAPTMISGRVSAATYAPTPDGGSFAVLGSESISLTERRIQELITDEMISLGFRPANGASNPDFAVIYSYSVGAGRTVVSSSPDFVWGGQEVHSSTTYPRYFQLALVDVPASHAEGQLVILWQSELYSTGSSQNISWLSETFVRELFSRFGQTVNHRRFIRPVAAPIL